MSAYFAKQSACASYGCIGLACQLGAQLSIQGAYATYAKNSSVCTCLKSEGSAM